MAQNVQRESRYRMIGIAVASVALLGWLLALYFWSVSNEAETELERQRALTATVEELETNIVALRSEAEQAGTDRDARTGELQETEQRLEEARTNVASLDDEVQTLRDENETLQAALESGRNELAELEEGISQARQTVADTSQELSDVGAQLEEAREQEAEYQSRVADLSAQIAEMTANAADTQERVQEAREAEASLEQEVLAARQELEEIQTTRATAEESVTTLVQRRESLATDTADAEEQIQSRQETLDRISQAIVERSQHLADLESRITQLQQQAGEPARRAAVGLMPGEPYTHEAVTATFNPDGTFQMENSETGDAVEGSYSVSDGVLTLSEVEGDLGDAEIPMNCSINAEAAGFTLGGEDGSCGPLEGISFSRGNN